MIMSLLTVRKTMEFYAIRPPSLAYHFFALNRFTLGLVDVI